MSMDFGHVDIGDTAGPWSISIFVTPLLQCHLLNPDVAPRDDRLLRRTHFGTAGQSQSSPERLESMKRFAVTTCELLTPREHALGAKRPELRIDLLGMTATVQPANEAAEAQFAAFKRLLGHQFGVRTGYPVLGDSSGSVARRVLPTEVRTRRVQMLEAEVEPGEPDSLMVTRVQAASAWQLACSSGYKVHVQKHAINPLPEPPQGSVPVAKFVSQFDTGTIELPDIGSLGVPLVVELARAYPGAVIGVVTLSRPHADRATRQLREEVQSLKRTCGGDDGVCDNMLRRVRFVSPGNLFNATLDGDQPGQFVPLLPRMDIMLLMPGRVLLHERLLDGLIGASAESWFRLFAVVDPRNQFESGVDTEVAAAWLGRARMRCRKGLRFIDRPIRHTFMKFKPGFDKAEQFGSGLGEMRSAIASSVARNWFVVDWTESLLTSRCHAPTQRAIDCWLHGRPPNVAMIAENAGQVRELKRLSSKRHQADWRTPDEARRDIFGTVQFGRRLIVQSGEFCIEKLGENIARHVDVLVMACSGPGLPTFIRAILDESGSKPMLVVDVRDGKNAPSQLRRWAQEREHNYLRSGWLRLQEDG